MTAKGRGKGSSPRKRTGGARPAIALRHPYPKSGSEDEFWERCEEAASRYARGGISYRELGARMGVSPTMAFRMVRRYLRGAARFFPAVELREQLALAYRQLFGLAIREFTLLEKPLGSLDDKGKLLPIPKDMADKDKVTAKIDLLARMESIVTRQAQLFGFSGTGVDLGGAGAGAADETPRSLPSPEDQALLRNLVRQQRAILEGRDREAVRVTLAGAAEATYTSLEVTNGKELAQKGPVDAEAATSGQGLGESPKGEGRPEGHSR